MGDAAHKCYILNISIQALGFLIDFQIVLDYCVYSIQNDLDQEIDYESYT